MIHRYTNIVKKLIPPPGKEVVIVKRGLNFFIQTSRRLLVGFFMYICFISTANAGTETYEYDALGRLVRVERGVDESVEYQYDSAGNRISTTSSYVQDPTIVFVLYNGMPIPIDTQL